MTSSITTATAKSDVLPQKLERFLKVRRVTEKICQPLETEDYVPQPMVDVSPPKWHLAHTTWFFETFVLQKYLPGYRSFHPDFNHLFNSYYNTVGNRVRRDHRGFMTRPTVKEVYEYRHYVTEHIMQLADILAEENENECLSLIEIGCQHEQQHQELLITDVKYILSCNVIRPVYHQPVVANIANPVKSTFLTVAEGVYPIGYQGRDFCFDNETEPHRVFLESFALRNTLVTNAEYLEFMREGGYHDFRHWLAEGWEAVNREGWQAPLYWEQAEGQWFEWTLMGRRPVVLQAPVTHISFYEAYAFASWAGKRLPTEFEWEVAAARFNPQGQMTNSQDHWIFQPQPAGSSNGPTHLQLFGETWQWTNSAYLPYPGFRIAEGALGEYNGKFMLNQTVLRGSSCATPADHARVTYRNFFPASARWQFSGIRLVE